jgi:hypothetical protein
MDGALTMDDDFQRHTLHQNQRQTLTNFYYSNQDEKESKTICYSIAAFKIKWLALNDGLFREQEFFLVK